jgi:Spy/CpxP family protein refolding chaperone
MKARNIILTIAAAALIAAPAVLTAQQGPGGPGGGSCDGTGPHGGGMGGPHDGGGPGGAGLLHVFQRVADRLELSTDQRTQIEAIIEGHRTATQSLRDEAAEARVEFRDNHGFGDFDEVDYRTFFEAQAQIQVELHLDGARATAEAWNILTPDQQEQLLEILELFRDGRGGPRHGGGKRIGPQ